MMDQEQEDEAKKRLQKFLTNWPHIRGPLHFTEMRAEKKGFAWLGRLQVRQPRRHHRALALIEMPALDVGWVTTLPSRAAPSIDVPRTGDDEVALTTPRTVGTDIFHVR